MVMTMRHMIAALAVLFGLSVAPPAWSDAGFPPPMYPDGSNAAFPTAQDNLGIAPTGNVLCVVGDSITMAPIQQNGIGFSATGGTGSISWGVAGLPAAFATTTSSAGTLYIKQGTLAWTATPATSITLTATDSLSVTGSLTGTIAVNIHGAVAFVPGAASGTLTVSYSRKRILDTPRGISGWIGPLTEGRVQSPQWANFGVTGDTTASVLARIAAITAETRCSMYHLMIGVNDIFNGVALATTKTNLDSIIASLRTTLTGKPVFVSTVLPTSSALSATQIAKLGGLNRYISTKKGTTANLYIVDPVEQYGRTDTSTPTVYVGTDFGHVSTTYDYSYDGTHPKSLGGYYITHRLIREMERVFALSSWPTGYSQDWDQYNSASNSGGNFLANGMMSFTGGTGTLGGRAAGVAPDGFSLSTTDGGCGTCAFVVTGSAATFADGTPSVEMDFSGNGDRGSSASMNLHFASSSDGNFSAGDKFRYSCRVEMDRNSAFVGPPTIEINLTTTNGISYLYAWGLETNTGGVINNADPSPTDAYAGYFTTPYSDDMALPAGITGSWTLDVKFYLTSATNQTIAGSARVGQCWLGKVA